MFFPRAQSHRRDRSRGPDVSHVTRVTWHGSWKLIASTELEADSMLPALFWTGFPVLRQLAKFIQTAAGRKYTSVTIIGLEIEPGKGSVMCLG